MFRWMQTGQVVAVGQPPLSAAGHDGGFLVHLGLLHRLSQCLELPRHLTGLLCSHRRWRTGETVAHDSLLSRPTICMAVSVLRRNSRLNLMLHIPSSLASKVKEISLAPGTGVSSRRDRFSTSSGRSRTALSLGLVLADGYPTPARYSPMRLRFFPTV